MTLRFFITAQGDLSLEKDKVAPDAVAANVRKALTLDPKADAMIYADRAVAHGHVLELIDALKTAGLRDVALGVEEKK